MGLAHQHQVQNFVLGTPCLSRGHSGLHQASQIHHLLSLSRIQLSQCTPGEGCTRAVFNSSKISHCPHPHPVQASLLLAHRLYQFL